MHHGVAGCTCTLAQKFAFKQSHAWTGQETYAPDFRNENFHKEKTAKLFKEQMWSGLLRSNTVYTPG